MLEIRKRLHVPLRVRAAALLPAFWVLAALAMSPVGAEVALADAPSASSSSTVLYGGLTSNGWPVIAEVTSNGRMIKRIVGGIGADCSQGGVLSFPSTWRNVPVSRRGGFKASYEDTGSSDGVEVTMSESLSGKLNRAHTRISATWRSSTTFRNPDGTVDTCDTGALRVTLHR
jgi:hypothetical protein